MTAKLGAILESIIKHLNDAAKKLHEEGVGTKVWTKYLKSVLCKLGEDKEYYVCASGVDPKTHAAEWLFDICWAYYLKDQGPKDSEGDINRQLGSLALIVESEWDHELPDILDDFEKLLVGRSSLKLMIFEQETEAGVNDIQDRLQKVIQGYAKSRLEAKDDVYLLSGYSLDEHRFFHAQATFEKLTFLP